MIFTSINFDNKVEKTKRLERKFILSSGQASLAVGELKKIGFKRKFPSRKISSVYFDDIEFSSLRDNIDGNPNRDKLRLRFYNDDLNSSKIEIKHKRGYVGYKSFFELETPIHSMDEGIQKTIQWAKKNLFKSIFARSLITYNRQYLALGQFTATVDKQVAGFRINSSKKLQTSAFFKYSVVEFKYPIDYDEEFRERQFFKNFSLRNTKCSKYSNSLIY